MAGHEPLHGYAIGFSLAALVPVTRPKEKQSGRALLPKRLEPWTAGTHGTFSFGYARMFFAAILPKISAFPNAVPVMYAAPCTPPTISPAA